MTTPLLEARGLTRGELLKAASLRIAAGERVGIRGPSGAGKTVLLRALAGLDPVDGGTIAFEGREVARAAFPAYRACAIYIHQRPALVEGSVLENLAFPFGLREHAKRTFRRERAVSLLASFGKPESFLDKRHSDLSGGEAQIVALVRALLLEPRLLLLDEPTASLDPESTTLVGRVLRAWAEDEPARRALVCVSHDHAFLDVLTTRQVSVAAGAVSA